MVVYFCWSGGAVHASHRYFTASDMVSAHPLPVVRLRAKRANLILRHWESPVPTGHPETICIGLDFHARQTSAPTWGHRCPSLPRGEFKRIIDAGPSSTRRPPERIFKSIILPMAPRPHRKCCKGWSGSPTRPSRRLSLPLSAFTLFRVPSIRGCF